MHKYIHSIDDLDALFEKIHFESEKLGSSYTAVMFEVKNSAQLNTFGEFLLHYLRISDTIFYYSDNKILLILEETTIRGGIMLTEKLREKIEEKGFNYDFFCAAIQGNHIEGASSLGKSLKKRISKAKEENTDECIHSLSNVD